MPIILWSILLESFELYNSKSETLAKCIIRVVNKITIVSDVENYFCLLLTDGAANMIGMGKFLKSLYPDLKHITCILHWLNLVTCKLFKKNPKLYYIYYQISSNI